MSLAATISSHLESSRPPPVELSDTFMAKVTRFYEISTAACECLEDPRYPRIIQDLVR
jgi:hypothetical protein